VNSKIFVVVLPLLLIAASIGAQLGAQIPAPYSRWIRRLDLSEADDIAYGSCVYGDYVAVVGAANFALFWSRAAVALLDRGTGSVVRVWMSKPGYLIEVSSFSACASVDDKLYVAGWMVASTLLETIVKGFIYVFDYNLTPLRVVEVDNATLSAVTYTNGYFYAAGEVYMDIDGDGEDESVIYVEKRFQDLTLIKYSAIYGSNWNTTYVRGIAVDGAAGNVWVAGYFEDDEENVYTVIALLDPDLKPVKLLIYSATDPYYIGKVSALCLGEDGYAYVFGSGILKLDRSGNAAALNRNVNASKALCLGRSVLAFDDVLTDLYMYVLDGDLNLRSTVLVERNASEWLFLSAGNPAFDGANVYFAAFTMLFKNAQWVVYSIALPLGQAATATYTVTQTVPIPVTTTLTTTILSTATTMQTTTVTSPYTVTVTETYTTTIPTTTTVKEITTVRETITSTATTTVLQTTTTTVEKPVTTTLRETTTTTILQPTTVTMRETLTETATTTTTARETYTTTIPTTITSRETTTVTTTATVVDWTTTVIVAAVLLLIGVAVGYTVKRR